MPSKPFPDPEHTLPLGDRTLPLDERILLTATDLFTRDGFKGVSFLAIGKELGITHSHIHYYFKTKEALGTAALARYAEGVLNAYLAVWLREDTDLLTKFVATRDWAWQRYLRYNPSGTGAAHWGLLDRFSHDSACLGPEMKRILRDTASELERLIRAGLEQALRSGELKPGTPIDDLLLQMLTVLFASRQTTRYGGRFDRVDALLRATYQTFCRAYGTRSDIPDWPPIPDAIRPTRP